MARIACDFLSVESAKSAVTSFGCGFAALGSFLVQLTENRTKMKNLNNAHIVNQPLAPTISGHLSDFYITSAPLDRKPALLTRLRTLNLRPQTFEPSADGFGR